MNSSRLKCVDDDWVTLTMDKDLPNRRAICLPLLDLRRGSLILLEPADPRVIQ